MNKITNTHIYFFIVNKNPICQLRGMKEKESDYNKKIKKYVVN